MRGEAIFGEAYLRSRNPIEFHPSPRAVPYLTLQFSTHAGPLIDLLVGVSRPRAAALRAAGDPVPSNMAIRGLIDTGASNTCVDPEVVTQLGITATGQVPMITPSTGDQPVDADLYDVSLVLAHSEISYTFGALPVMCSSLRHQGFDVLIGRDVLERCLFVYDGRTQIYTLAF